MATISIDFTANGGRHELTTDLPAGTSAKDKVCQVFGLDPSQVTITGTTER